MTSLPDPYSAQELRLLRLLSDRFPTITAAHIEMMNLSAILALPKGTEHYLSDIHGAFEQFEHILRHASGAIRRKVRQTFGDALAAEQQTDLALLIYYPETKLRQVAADGGVSETWFTETIGALVRVARKCGAQYTRSKVRKRLEPQFAYLLEELLSEQGGGAQERYYADIIRSVTLLGEGERVIITLAYLIQSLVVDRLNIIGDIYDRGGAAERVLDRLMSYHDVSVQWGNHDVSWMGAAAGCPALVANVVRLTLRYATLATLTSGYGINLRALAHLAETVYGGDPCERFLPKADTSLGEYAPELLARMHKAVTVMQLKLEAQTIHRHPEYEMEGRLVLDHLNLDAGTLSVAGALYPLLDTNWPTLGAERAELTPAEQTVITDLVAQFTQSPRLQTHIRFLYAYGNMFEVRDGNLKFHGCLPVTERGDFVPFELAGETVSGPALLARFEALSRDAYFSRDPDKRAAGQDAMWYLWCGKNSPLFGRSKMTTFERYVLANEETHDEPKGPYYALRADEGFCRALLRAFGADPGRGHIINGHTPVKVKKGARPILAGGKLIIIDGGMSEAYRSVTGIAGYTLVGTSHELVLAAHEPFSTAEQMILEHRDPAPRTEQVEVFSEQILIAKTDTGRALYEQLGDLEKLVQAYRQGVLAERPVSR